MIRLLCVNAQRSIVWFKNKNKSIFFLFNDKSFFFNFLFLCNFDYNVGIEPQFGLREVCNWNNKTDWPRIEFWYYTSHRSKINHSNKSFGRMSSKNIGIIRFKSIRYPLSLKDFQESFLDKHEIRSKDASFLCYLFFFPWFLSSKNDYNHNGDKRTITRQGKATWITSLNNN